MGKVLQERGFGILLSSTESNPRDHVKAITTSEEPISNSYFTYDSSFLSKIVQDEEEATYDHKPLVKPIIPFSDV